MHVESDFGIDNNSDNTFTVYVDGNETDIVLGDYQSGGVSGIIPPQTVPYSDRWEESFISFDLGGLTYRFSPTSMDLKGGYEYTFTLTIVKSKVQVKQFSVKKWTDNAGECTQTGDAMD